MHFQMEKFGVFHVYMQDSLFPNMNSPNIHDHFKSMIHFGIRVKIAKVEHCLANFCIIYSLIICSKFTGLTI